MSFDRAVVPPRLRIVTPPEISPACSKADHIGIKTDPKRWREETVLLGLAKIGRHRLDMRKCAHCTSTISREVTGWDLWRVRGIYLSNWIRKKSRRVAVRVQIAFWGRS